MSSTHLSLHFHVVFSTKNREPRIAAEWSDRFHSYLGGVARSSGAIPEIIGGVADHVHLLIGLPATARLADVVRDVKAVSSKWVHEEIGDRAFAWQEGYGAFTVSPSHREIVRGYIARQEEHHRKRTFQDEYPNFCNAVVSISTSAIFGNPPPSATPPGRNSFPTKFRWLAPPANFHDPCRDQEPNYQNRNLKDIAP